MANWSQHHDLVYAFVCVSFLADGEVDESEKEATESANDSLANLFSNFFCNCCPGLLKLALRFISPTFLDLLIFDNCACAIEELVDASDILLRRVRISANSDICVVVVC